MFLLFNIFSKIGNKIVFQLDLSSYTAIINAFQTAVIDQFQLKQTKIELCSSDSTYDFGVF